MTTSRQYTGERIDVGLLTASTITDNQLDAIRAELAYYRSRDERANHPTVSGIPPTTDQAPEDASQLVGPSRPAC
ncbi:hypothetical protein [Streptomyces sp. NPDC086787]|uniref:hypothetical protein n=1 Tax=Streptomyces sp. NPDC086787 TaxID=3365759 RepID=UPI00382577F7